MPITPPEPNHGMAASQENSSAHIDRSQISSQLPLKLEIGTNISSISEMHESKQTQEHSYAPMQPIEVQNIDDKTEIQQLRRLQQDLTDQTDDYKDQVYVPPLNTFSFTQSIDQAFNNN